MTKKDIFYIAAIAFLLILNLINWTNIDMLLVNYPNEMKDVQQRLERLERSAPFNNPL